MGPETKNCKNCENNFTVEPEDFGFYEKMDALPPSLCPDCRMKIKLNWRNEHTFYKRACDLCGSSIISMYNPSHPAPVYCASCYHSDKWDPYNYGADYDPGRPFWSQFKDLFMRVPKAATHIGTGEGSININSDYVNFAGGNKNCYLIFNSTLNEDCNYSRGIMKCKNTNDTYFADQLENGYECVNVNRCNQVFWGQNSYDSLNSYFVINCVDVQNCFGCFNLRHKSYHFLNQPLPKEEWEKKAQEILGSHAKLEEFKKEFRDFSLKQIWKENSNFKEVNCTGDYIFESKNCTSCFEAFGSEDSKYCFSIKLLKDGYDVVGRGVKSELLLETVAVGHGCSRVMGSWSVENSHDVEYSYDLRASSYCFGCVGLKHGEYSILNRKYSEQEYGILTGKIITELKQLGIYGSYLPIELSPWAYNESLASENYPATREDIIKNGFRWEENIPRTSGKETFQPENIPDHIKDVSDSIVEEVLRCVECGYNYRLTGSELNFYKQKNISIPRKCFNCRHFDRVKRRGDFRLHDRNCAKCQKAVKTTYAPDRPEIVYCEQCYNSEIV